MSRARLETEPRGAKRLKVTDPPGVGVSRSAGDGPRMRGRTRPGNPGRAPANRTSRILGSARSADKAASPARDGKRTVDSDTRRERPGMIPSGERTGRTGALPRAPHHRRDDGARPSAARTRAVRRAARHGPRSARDMIAPTG
ncbi:hypothetical protein GCM10010327_46730 [Streptomyces nitrosporeus]|nr:hypothetical protein GCM10010327_46730 [Streptomyces nitrosporeus]